jgi:hypothetical protein
MPLVADAKTAAAMRPFSFGAADYTARTGRPGQALFPQSLTIAIGYFKYSINQF